MQLDGQTNEMTIEQGGTEMKLTYIYHMGLYLNLFSFSVWTTKSMMASVNLVCVAILIEFIIDEMRNERR